MPMVAPSGKVVRTSLSQERKSVVAFPTPTMSVTKAMPHQMVLRSTLAQRHSFMRSTMSWKTRVRYQLHSSRSVGRGVQHVTRTRTIWLTMLSSRKPPKGKPQVMTKKARAQSECTESMNFLMAATDSSMRRISLTPSVRTMTKTRIIMPAPLKVTTTFARPDSAPMMEAAIQSPRMDMAKIVKKTRRPLRADELVLERTMRER
mmetsp:Transcript_9045/g.26336  ORF Transcript_9045/g.26336 Transcript_9045/m.26336 type:complete len:204 (+) Transcript_9045:1285-1896(+)